MNYAPAETLFDEITDFLASAPSAEELITFRPSEKLNQRLHELLDKNSADTINADERAELNEFLRFGHLLQMIQLKARKKLMNEE